MGDNKETSGSTQIAELTAQLASISLGLPSFWSTHPDAWFINIESQFALANITREETKFHKVVAALPEDIATQVLDITQNSYQAGNYTKLKTAILKLFTKSKAKRRRRTARVRQHSKHEAVGNPAQASQSDGRHQPS